MLSISKHPRPKHGQNIKNPGYSDKSKPIIKIKAVKVTKKGGSKKRRKTHKKSRKTKRRKTMKRRKRKAGSHSMIGRMTKPMKRAMGYYSQEPQHDYNDDNDIDPSYYKYRNIQPPQPIISKDPIEQSPVN